MSEALPLFEDLYEQQSGAEVALLIGRIYENTTVPELAKSWYEKARQQAGRAQSLETEAKALEGLATVVRQWDDIAQSKALIADAVQKYKALGAAKEVGRLDGK
jgi:hypothetical protein